MNKQTVVTFVLGLLVGVITTSMVGQKAENTQGALRNTTAVTSQGTLSPIMRPVSTTSSALPRAGVIRQVGQSSSAPAESNGGSSGSGTDACFERCERNHAACSSTNSTEADEQGCENIAQACRNACI